MNKNDALDNNYLKMTLAILHIIVMFSGIGLIVLGICFNKELSNLGRNEDKFILGLIITLVLLGCILISTSVVGLFGVHDSGHLPMNTISGKFRVVKRLNRVGTPMSCDWMNAAAYARVTSDVTELSNQISPI
ncbi:hypothetical protein EG68_04912 [Paragonimus skrjabini miyazakii]|uniref:Uncharacterized protein n=1 Tax=Paragonimus skrjabini miyazakii TaxID=59628 RepID=A0A8S9YSM8_9TREM|nr:hypothetical protein EG68_04912 [Paragonimus skrjabini miyazakii]